MEEKETTIQSWERGQRQLVAGDYVAARESLVAAEALAWRLRDAVTLARVHLPLLEARRQIRYLAVEGRITISTTEIHADSGRPGIAERLLLLPDPQAAAVRAAQLRLAAAGDSHFAAGIPVAFTSDPAAPIGLSTDPALQLPLPPPAIYSGTAGLGILARESLVIAWEALALHWQRRHPLASNFTPWDELAWLRAALDIDPACEPVSMRLIALAEGIERAGIPS